MMSDTVTVNRAALHMLMASGKAVLASAQAARIAGREAPDFGYQLELRNAITSADRALGHPAIPPAAAGERGAGL